MTRTLRSISQPLAARDRERTGRIWIVGGSVRAAAQSAAAAGLSVIATDRFGDEDLAQAAERVFLVRRWSELGRLAEEFVGAVDGWCAIGPLENHGGVLQRLTDRLPSWNASVESIERVRSRSGLRQLLAKAGLPLLRETKRLAPTEPLESWLCKPKSSGGGLGVALPQGRTAPRACYFQQRVEGDEWGVTYLGDRERARFLYAARPWPRGTECGAADYLYRGSLAPLPLPPALHAALEPLAESLVRDAGLCGLFGIDVIWDGRRPWVLEVNPRYPASAELYERVSGVSALQLHVNAVGGTAGIADAPKTNDSHLVAGKKICYAPSAVEGAEAAQIGRTVAGAHGLELADIPRHDVACRAGDPLTTLVGWDTSYRALLERMNDAERELCATIQRVAKCD